MADTSTPENRKQEERAFHNQLRDVSLERDPSRYAYLHANEKYYSVAQSSTAFLHDWVRTHCPGKRVLDYACGNGALSMFMAQHGADVVGVDISDVSIENCRRRAHDEGFRIRFETMDCESLAFDDRMFDVVAESGVLHHMDLSKATSEIARVLRTDGQAICSEALGHNPIFQMYRRATPHLRTEFETEHILTMRDISRMSDHFHEREIKYFHLMALAAVPLRGTPVFTSAYGALEVLDSVLMRVPLIQQLAWIAVFILRRPRS